jgi:hypothetical protein
METLYAQSFHEQGCFTYPNLWSCTNYQDLATSCCLIMPFFVKRLRFAGMIIKPVDPAKGLSYELIKLIRVGFNIIKQCCFNIL